MYYKKSLVLALLVSFAFGLSAFMPQKSDEKKAKNLKVLPKDISHEDLDKIMDNFKMALGVKCGYCHAPMADNQRKLDFASDAKPEKETARDMMRMTAKINKKYFHNAMENDKTVSKIACVTCHNGKTEPAAQ